MKGKTKIRQITIINQQETCTYYLGQDVNGLKIDTIEDHGEEFNDSMYNCYVGKSEDKQTVFCVENVPVVLEYYWPPLTTDNQGDKS